MGRTGPVDVRNPCLLYTEVRQLKSHDEWNVGGARKLRPQGFVPTRHSTRGLRLVLLGML